MAQLTWQNVNAPNFSGVNDLLRTSEDAMNKGFDSGTRALEGYQKDLTQSVTAQIMQAAMNARDPAQLQGILAQADPAYMSPEAIKFVAGRPQDLASLAQTQANTGYIGANTDRVRQAISESAELHPI